MAKFNYGVAVAFGTQDAEESYNDALDAITTSLTYSETPGADSQKAGLVLGDPESGFGKSGLDFTYGRSYRDKAFQSGSYTRPISDFLTAEIPTFTFTFPFCGNRADTTATPVDGDFIPLDGINAILEGAYLTGAAWGSGVGHRYVFGSTNPISALVYVNGNRLELMDCRTSLSIAFPPKSIPLCTATVEVGSIKEHTVAALPSTLTYGEQATVSAPTCVSLANQWQDTRGFSSLTLSVAPSYETVEDMNQLTGEVKEAVDRETKVAGTIFADDTVDEGYEYSQIIAAVTGTLDQISWQVGSDAVGSDPALAVQFVLPKPELLTAGAASLGTKAGYDIDLIARGDTANSELEVIFR